MQAEAASRLGLTQVFTSAFIGGDRLFLAASSL